MVAEAVCSRFTDTCSSPDVKRLQKVPSIRSELLSPEKSLGMEFKGFVEKGVVVVESPMPAGHDSLNCQLSGRSAKSGIRLSR